MKRAPALYLPNSKNFKIVYDGKITFSHDILVRNDLQEEVFEQLDTEKQEVLFCNISEWMSFLTIECIHNLVPILLKVWELKSTTNNYDAIAQCAFEISSEGYIGKDCLNRLLWCHRIQCSLSDEDIRDGWRVSFGKYEGHSCFFYLNKTNSRRKLISFRRV